MLLRKIQTSKAPGPDNIPDQVLKECAPQLAEGLTTSSKDQLTRDVFQGTGPTPMFPQCSGKKGDKHLAENYRPVSLTSVTCKHIICGHLRTHMEKNNNITNRNHASLQKLWQKYPNWYWNPQLFQGRRYCAPHSTNWTRKWDWWEPTQLA